MQSNKGPVRKGPPGDVFSTFLDTVRGEGQGERAPIFSVLRLLKVAGPHPLEKLLRIFADSDPNLMSNLLQAAEEDLVTIGDDPNLPGEKVVTITDQGRDLLATLKQQKS